MLKFDISISGTCSSTLEELRFGALPAPMLLSQLDSKQSVQAFPDAPGFRKAGPSPRPEMAAMPPMPPLGMPPMQLSEALGPIFAKQRAMPAVPAVPAPGGQDLRLDLPTVPGLPHVFFSGPLRPEMLPPRRPQLLFRCADVVVYGRFWLIHLLVPLQPRPPAKPGRQ